MNHLAPTAALVLALAGCGAARGGGAPIVPPVETVPGCEADLDCEGSLVCRSGSCVPYEGLAGDPCDEDLDCALNLDCRSGSCVP